MAGKPRTARRGCLKKRRYVCEDDAVTASARYAQRYNASALNTYLCNYCNGWHLTTRRQ